MTDTHDSPPAAGEVLPVTWEDDENRATLFLRSLCVLVAGGFLAYAQCRAPYNWTNQAIGANWNRWVATSIVANLIFPLGIIWFFFGQGIVRLEWLRDQKFNAWNYGWSFRPLKRHLLLGVGMFLFMLPFVVWAARTPDSQSFYRDLYFPPQHGARDMAWLLATLVVYMFCWEFFFRGFLLFGMAQGLGPVAAIILQAAVFGLTHYVKGPVEFYSSFAGGLVLGWVCWREKSFVPAFITHALVHVTLAIATYL